MKKYVICSTWIYKMKSNSNQTLSKYILFWYIQLSFLILYNIIYNLSSLDREVFASVIIKDMKSVIIITASNPRIYYGDTIFKTDSNGPDTHVTFPETSNLPHLSTNDTTIVSLTEENIIIRSFVPYVSLFQRTISNEILRKNWMNLLSLHENADHTVDAMLVVWHIEKPWKIWKS